MVSVGKKEPETMPARHRALTRSTDPSARKRRRFERADHGSCETGSVGAAKGADASGKRVRAHDDDDGDDDQQTSSTSCQAGRPMR